VKIGDRVRLAPLVEGDALPIYTISGGAEPVWRLDKLAGTFQSSQLTPVAVKASMWSRIIAAIGAAIGTAKFGS
jgi:hypothetical protein